MAPRRVPRKVQLEKQRLRQRRYVQNTRQRHAQLNPPIVSNPSSLGHHHSPSIPFQPQGVIPSVETTAESSHPALNIPVQAQISQSSTVIRARSPSPPPPSSSSTFTLPVQAQSNSTSVGHCSTNSPSNEAVPKPLARRRGRPRKVPSVAPSQPSNLPPPESLPTLDDDEPMLGYQRNSTPREESLGPSSVTPSASTRARSTFNGKQRAAREDSAAREGSLPTSRDTIPADILRASWDSHCICGKLPHRSFEKPTDLKQRATPSPTPEDALSLLEMANHWNRLLPRELLPLPHCLRPLYQQDMLRRGFCQVF